MRNEDREEGRQEVPEAKTCWEESGWGASPGIPEMFWELGTPTDLITDGAQAVPHRAQGSEAESGPSLCSVTTFSQPDLERHADTAFPVGGEGYVYSCKKSYQGCNISVRSVTYVTSCLY